MNLNDIQPLVIDPALFLLPEKMDSSAARAMLITFGLQETRWTDRHQKGGSAHGYFQFEPIAVRDVLERPSTKQQARGVLGSLDYPSDPEALFVAIQHNDLLACTFARLKLWMLPDALPGRDDPGRAWEQYLSAWRPGKPHPETWEGFYEKAWDLVSPMPKRQFAEADMEY